MFLLVLLYNETMIKVFICEVKPFNSVMIAKISAIYKTILHSVCLEH